MSHYKPYPAYKDSEVEWLGKVPEHWEIRPIKSLANSPETLFVDGNWIESKNLSDQGIRYITTGNVGAGFYKEQGSGYISEQTFNELQCLDVLPGDILISRLNPPIGRACIVPTLGSRVVTSVDNVIFRPSLEFLPSYVVYRFSAADYFHEMSLLASGATMQRVSRTELGNVRIAWPSKSEQVAIAAHLDRETTRIDTLIAKKTRFIELLKEKRQALITQAVTKGLNPNVKMKDSGVAWLGEVPEHWDVKNVAYVIDDVGDVDHFMPASVEKGVPYLMTGDIQELASLVNFDECKQVSHSDYAQLSRKIKSSKGDVILARYATIGTSMYVDIDADFLVSYSCVTIKPKASGITGVYLAQYFKSSAFYHGISNQINTNTQDNVGINDLKKVVMVLPDLSEQKSISEYLISKLKNIDHLAEVSQRSVYLLKERRSALITAAVTGQIDLREAA